MRATAGTQPLESKAKKLIVNHLAGSLDAASELFKRCKKWLFAAFFVIMSTTGAAADLKLCNSTASRVGVSIGYKDASGWATEGWWNIASQTCETLLKGVLPSRFVYVHAVDYDRGGEWVGTNFMCTHEKSFAIRGVEGCDKRGYRRTGFFEVDTGESKAWTIRLTDPETGGKKPQ